MTHVRRLVLSGVMACAITPFAAWGQDGGALLARGDSAWAKQQFDAARAAYGAFVARDSTGAPRAVFRLATLRAWENRLDDAIVLYARYRRLEPTDDGGIVAMARALAWRARYDESLGALDSLLRRRPDDREAGVLRPTVLAWAGRLDEAEVEYRRLSAAGVPEAAKGLARVTGWRGALDRSAVLWRDFLASNADDADAWVGLAQIERWRGRYAEARDALAMALSLRPDDADARQQQAWVVATMATALEPQFALGDDTDGNRQQAVQVGVGGQVPWWPGQVRVLAHYRDATLPSGAGLARGASSGARATVTWLPRGGRWSLRADLGATQVADRTAGVVGAPRVLPLVSARLGRLVTPGVTMGLTAATAPFDETAPLIRNGVRSHSVEADWAVVLPGRLTWAGLAGLATVTGGDTANRRVLGQSTLTWALTRGRTLGLHVRHMGYDRFARVGYFSPQAFTTGEVQAHFELPRDLGWNILADAGIGLQALRIGTGGTTTQPMQRGTIGVLWRPVPGYEASVGLTLANVASPFAVTQAGTYRWGGITARGRLLFR
jgi:tetratricopeptide (TPR) repeat protein